MILGGRAGIPDVDDLARLEDLTAAAGVRWGIGREHRAWFGLGDVAQNTWQLGVQRLVMGEAFSADELAESRNKEAWTQRIARLGYWEWDVARRSFLASEECFRLMGSPNALSSHPISMSVCDIAKLFQYVQADERLRVEGIVARILGESGSTQFECHLVGMDDAIRAVRLEIEVERSNGIMVVRMNRPERMNALNQEVREAMAEAWNEFHTSRELEVGIITGTGRAFCAGFDQKRLSGCKSVGISGS